MYRNPAFLFYDGDAARDVSHMNRLERGCYFDLIQAQRKFGGFTMEQARKILGHDFDECWPSVSMVLSCENDVFFIEWVKNSINKRIEHAEKQRERIQTYWDNKKKIDIPRNNHGITTDIPLETETEKENKKELKEESAERGKKGKIKFIPPSFGEFKAYCKEHGFSGIAERVFEYYKNLEWEDSQGRPIKSWKAKLQAVWFRPDQKDKDNENPNYDPETGIYGKLVS